MTDADHHLTVLVVDDDAVARQALERGLLNEPLLQARGIRTQRAGDGKRALGQVKKEMPDAVIIDLFMPRMDGFELARALRQGEDTAHLPLVIVSGVFKEDEQVKALMAELGVRFFTKPVPVTELAQTIIEQVDAADGGGDARPSSVPRGADAPSIKIAAPAVGRAPSPPLPAARSGFAAAPSSKVDLPPLPPSGRSQTGPYGAIKGVPAAPPSAAANAAAALAALHGHSSTTIGLPLPPDGVAPTAAVAAASGDLSKVAVPRLLLDHLLAGSTGTLVLRRGQMNKQIFFHAGKTIAAASNLRQEALGRLLVSRGVLDEDQLTFLLGEMKKSGEKMGSVLVTLGWLSPEDVLKYLVAQTRKRVVDALRYPDGAYEFVAGNEFLEREIEHDLDMPRLLFVGLQKTASPDALVERLVEHHGGSAILPSPRLARFRAEFDEVFGGELTKLLTDEPTIGALVLRPDAAALLVAVDALILCGLAQFDRSSNDGEVELPSAGEAARSSLSLENLGDVALTPSQSQESLPALDLDFASRGPAADGRLDAPRGAVPNASFSPDDSGVVNVDAIAALTFPVPGASAGASATKKEGDPRNIVLNAYLQIHGKNLYQILGLEIGATIDQVVAAYEEKTRTFAPDLFAAADLGSDAGKLDNIRAAYNRAFKVLSNPRLRLDYDKAQGGVAAQSPEDDLLGAEMTFGEARQLLDSGQAERAIRKMELALKAAPDEPTYHAFLGWALWKARGAAGAEPARQKITHALSLDPDQIDAHDFLGQIAAATADEETARVALDKALELDPSRIHCLDLLAPIYASYSEFHATERVYKRMLRALGDRELPLRQRLWKDLAALYENEFDDQASARIAYEMAARISPNDIELQRKVVALNAHDLDRWKDIARALSAEWKMRPDDTELGGALVDLFLRVGKNDAATIAAAALVLRGQASREHQLLAEKSAPRLLTRLSQPIEAAILQRAKHTDEDTDVEMMFATLAHEGILPAFTDADVGLYGDPALAEKDQPEVFRRVLEYVCGVLKVKKPGRVFEYEALEQDARLADTRPHALFVSPVLLRSTDTVELGFRLGRAMSFGSPGRLTGASRSGRQLRPYLMATVAYARQALAGGDIDIVPIVERLENCEPATRARLKELGSQLVRDRSAINLSSWAKSLNRTATRLGLLISGDLLRVGRIVAEEDGAEALDDLIEFALSLEHFDLREELGISSVV